MLGRFLVGTMSTLILSTAAFAQIAPNLPDAESIAIEEAKCTASCTRRDRFCGAPNGTSAKFCADRKTVCVAKCRAPV